MAEREGEDFLFLLKEERHLLHDSRVFLFLKENFSDQFMVKLLGTALRSSSMEVRKIAASLVGKEITMRMLSDSADDVWLFIRSSSLKMMDIEDEDFAYGSEILVAKIAHIVIRTWPTLRWVRLTQRIEKAFLEDDDYFLERIGRVIIHLPIQLHKLFFLQVVEPVFDDFRKLVLHKLIGSLRRGNDEWPYRFITEFYDVCTSSEWDDVMNAIVFSPILEEDFTHLEPSKVYKIECIIAVVGLTQFTLCPNMVSRILQAGTRLWELPHPPPDPKNYKQFLECVLGAGLYGAILSNMCLCVPIHEEYADDGV